MSVALLSPNKHPIRVDCQVECGQTLLVKSNQSEGIEETEPNMRTNAPT